MELIGSKFAGHYQIVDIIGKGGFATVYRAIETSLNRVVALKIMAPPFQRDDEFVRRFQQEALSVARLDHPNIIRILDIGESEDLRYIVYEFVNGQSLQQIINRTQSMDISSSIAIITQVAQALDYAHGLGIIHRDIKPSNILLFNSGRVVLSDFGLALSMQGTSLTRIGTVLGTPEYMSPEQAEGKQIDRRSDIYSLGVVSYQMLTGRPPFSGETPAVVLHKTITQSPPSPRSLNPRIPAALEQVLNRSLAKNPDQRFQEAGQFAVAFDSAAGVRSANIAPRTRELPEPSMRQVSSLSRMIIGIALIALLLLGAGITLVFFGTKFGVIVWTWLSDNLILAVSMMILIALLALIFLSSRRVSFKSSFPGEMEILPKSVEPIPQVSGPITGEMLPVSSSPVPSTAILRGEPSAMAWFLVLSGPNRGRQLRIAERTTLGRDGTSCDIVLDDTSVSRQHAVLRWENGQFVLFDRASTNGTFVNGHRVQRTTLHDRDEIRLGNAILIFVQVANPEDLTVEAKGRLTELDEIWADLKGSVRND